MRATDRAIIGYHTDEVGDWVAELECGHNQHVRHKPPMQWREWILDADSRRSRIGTPLPCRLCDQPEETAGGDPACWAGLICPECGGVAGDGTGHHPGCAAERGGC